MGTGNTFSVWSMFRDLREPLYKPEPAPSKPVVTSTPIPTPAPTPTLARSMVTYADAPSIYGQSIVSGSGRRLVTCAPLWAATSDKTVSFAVSLGTSLHNSNTKTLSIHRIYFDDTLVVDNTPEADQTKAFVINYKIYKGNPNQLPDQDIAKIQGEENTPAFRDLNYMVFKNLELSSEGFDTIPVVKVEFSETDEYDPYYKNAERPSSTENGYVKIDPVFNSAGSIAYQCVRLKRNPSDDPENYITLFAWDTRNGDLISENLITYKGAPLESENIQEMHYHPHMDRIILMASNKKNAFDQSEAGSRGSTCLIVNPLSGEIDDSVMGPVLPSAYAELIDSQTNGARGVVTVDNDPINGLLKDYEKYEGNYGLNKGSVNQAFPQFYTVWVPHNNKKPPKRQIVSNTGKAVGRDYAIFATYIEESLISFSFNLVTFDKFVINGVERWLVTSNATGGSMASKANLTTSNVGPILAVTDLRPNEVVLTCHSTQVFYCKVPYGATSAEPSMSKLNCLPPAFGANVPVVENGGLDRTFTIKWLVSSDNSDSLSRDAVINKYFIDDVGNARLTYNTQDFIRVPFNDLRVGFPFSKYHKFETNSSHIFIGVGHYIIDLDNYDIKKTFLDGAYRRRSGSHDGDEINEITGNVGASSREAWEPGNTVSHPTKFVGFKGLGTVGVETFLNPIIIYPLGFEESRIGIKNLLSLYAEKAGFSPEDLSFDNWIDSDATQYWGSILESSVDFWDVVNNLALVYNFNVYESQGKIKFSMTSNDETVDTDLDYHETDLPTLSPSSGGQTDSDPIINITRVGKHKLPSKVRLGFVDYNDRYQQSEVYANKENYPYERKLGSNEVNISVNICMNVEEAITRVHEMLHKIWTTRNQYELRIPRDGMLIEPGDTIQVRIEDVFFQEDSKIIETQVYNVKTIQVTMNADWSSTVSAEQFNRGKLPDYSRTNVGQDTTNPVILSDAKVLPIITDLPLLYNDESMSDIESHSNDTSVITDYTLIQEVINPNVTFDISVVRTEVDTEYGTERKVLDKIESVKDIKSLCGVIENRLLPTKTPCMIHEESIIIQTNAPYLFDEIPKPTFDEFLGGKYLLAIQHFTGFELISYREVIDLGAGRFEFTGLIRGRNGTEKDSAAVRAAGSRAFLVSQTNNKDFVVNANEIEALQLAANPTGRGASVAYKKKNTRTYVDEVLGNKHQPNSPVGIKVTRVDDGVNDGVNITWLKRSRLPYPLSDGEPGPLPTFYDDTNTFLIKLFNPDSVDPILVKEVEGTSAFIPYTEEITNYLQTAKTVYVMVAQKPKKSFLEYVSFSPYYEYTIEPS